MDFITCNAFLVFEKSEGVYELSIEPINIRKGKILLVEMADVVPEGGTFDGNGNILSGKLQDSLTRFTFDPEYFEFICEKLAINPLTCSIGHFSAGSDIEEEESSIVVDIDFSTFIENHSTEYDGVWKKQSVNSRAYCIHPRTPAWRPYNV